tara:strand:- start:1961 stop:6130 length:4170 start_codon:yes stop_codon:yes gene_type:complete
MAESKNYFTNSKMNRDLDDRLVPRGEYREAQNVSISASEGDDVGTLQNILGNIRVFTPAGPTSLTEYRNLEIIGHHIDDVNNYIYIFLTNYTDSSTDTLSNHSGSYPGAISFILSYNTETNVSSTLSEGKFLNFSKTHPILGVNIIEDLLFFTDNRNQPRKINITTATNNVGYYDTEDKISVAKFFPFNAPELYREIKIKAEAAGTNTRSMVLPLGQLTTGNGIWGITEGMMVTSTGINSFVRDVNVDQTDPGTGITTNYCRLSNLRPAGTWADDEIITFTEYGLKDCVSKFLPYEFEAELTADPSDGNRFIIASSQQPQNGTTNLINGMHASCQAISVVDDQETVVDLIPENVYITVAPDTYSVEFFQESAGIVTAFVEPLLDGETVKFFRVNPDYDPDFSGDESYLKDKFIRFSYRYKFDDGEYSLIAPFTQIAFTPEDDGYLLDESESKTARSSVMQNMENKLNCINLSIYTPFPSSDGTIETATKWKDAVNMLNIDSIEILCAFSDETRIRLIERLDVEDILSLSSTYAIYPLNSEKFNLGNSNALTYKYNSQKPSVTLPESDTTRVFDKVPVRALSQESAGNRIIYGNFIDKHTSPDSLQFRVSASKKSDITFELGSQSKRSLPNHTLKENRTYQVGVVLSDRYGRQSDVILSDVEQGVSIGTQGALYGESTLFHPYGNKNKFSAIDILDWTGDQLFLYLEQAIPSEITKPGYPGFYNELINPLGWFTYKVVVKQQEQEYYNVFSAGAWRQDEPVIGNQFSYISLVNDNINKIPKNLSEVGPGEKSFSSDVLLYPKVNPTKLSISTDGSSTFANKASYVIFSSKKSDKVDRIIYNSALTQGSNDAGPIYKGSEVPPEKIFMGRDSTLARVSNNQTFGFRDDDIAASTDGQYYFPANAASNIPYNSLGVYETNPVVSNLDIYWETSTSGYISEFNSDINLGSLGPVSIVDDFFEFFENTPKYQIGNGSVALPQFGTVLYTIEALNAAGTFVNDPTATCILNSVTSSDTGSANLVNDFLIAPQAGSTVGSFSGRFNLYASKYQYYRLGRQFNFFITITANNVTNSFSFNGQISNINPQFGKAANGINSDFTGKKIPFSFLPFKDYARTTSSGLSIRPDNYSSPYTGTNFISSSVDGISDQGLVPRFYFLNHSTQYVREDLNWKFNDNPGLTYPYVNNIFYLQWFFNWGVFANPSTNQVVPTGTYGFPFPNADSQVYWPKGEMLASIRYNTGPILPPTQPNDSQWVISDPIKDTSYLSGAVNKLAAVNGTLLNSSNFSIAQENLRYEITDISGGYLSFQPTFAQYSQSIGINLLTGVLEINDQRFIDDFGVNGTVGTLVTNAAPNTGLDALTEINVTVRITDANGNGQGALSTELDITVENNIIIIA